MIRRCHGDEVELSAFTGLTELHVGFTATRLGLSLLQRQGLLRLLRHFLHQKVVFHHGDAIGGDDDGHDCARALGFKVHGHPCNLPGQRAFNRCDLLAPEKPPLERNSDIVSASALLIVCPVEDYEVQRSGTWATARRGRQHGRPTIFIWRDGTPELFTWKREL